MVKCDKCGKNLRTLKGHVCKQEDLSDNSQPLLKRHETFLHQRLQQYINKDVNVLTDGDIAGLMKAMRIFCEQQIRRVAMRQGWTWANPQTRVKSNVKKNIDNRKSGK